MINKIAISIEAFDRRCAEFTAGAAITRFKPHGVVAVLGPFNFPGHLPNGHIVPALLAGNTVVFKPSELAPATAAHTVEIWARCGLPQGVLNLVHGDGRAGKYLTENPSINGVFFTGSASTGLKLQNYFAGHPEVILALEMGGNNPLVVDRVENFEAAILIAVESAYLTAGQRCTCARRLIVQSGAWGDEFVARFADTARGIRVGRPDDEPPPFMGPVISPAAARGVLDAQRALIARGAVPLLKAKLLHEGTGLMGPGLLDVTPVQGREDGEVFGPMLQVVRVADFGAAVAEANDTSFGLAAGLVSDDRAAWETFRQSVRAGVVNWNRPTTGASSAAPFGGVGRSGNFRPSAWFAADYCSWPVASIEAEHPTVPGVLLPGLPSPAPGQ
jgi:succinylglutamic semialdehyde dehydrogenase